MRAIVLSVVLLAATVAQAEDRDKCIRDLVELHGDKVAAKHQCDPKNFVTNPNEYGWVCNGNGPTREKGMGLKQKKYVVCE